MEHSEVLRSLRTTGDYSDLTIICGSLTFNVHKCVICLRSSWFKIACQEGRWKEGEEGVIELKATGTTGEDEDFSCDDPEAVRLMLDYLYLGDYKCTSPGAGPILPSAAGSFNTAMEIEQPAPSSPAWGTNDTFGSGYQYNRTAKKKRKNRIACDASPEPPAPEFPEPPMEAEPKGSLSMHARLYAMGGKFDIKGLQTTAVAKLQRSVQGVWDRGDFAKAISIAFGSTGENDRALRDVIIQTILSCSANLAADPVIEKAVNSVEGLAFELFKAQSLKQSSSRKSFGY